MDQPDHITIFLSYRYIFVYKLIPVNRLIKIIFKLELYFKYLDLFNFNFNKLIIIFKEFENLFVEKMTLSTALGFEPRSFELVILR